VILRMRSEVDPVICDSLWRAESAEATLLPGLVTFSPVELLTVNPFHLKKGNMLPAFNATSSNSLLERALYSRRLRSCVDSRVSQPWPNNSKM